MNNYPAATNHNSVTVPQPTELQNMLPTVVKFYDDIVLKNYLTNLPQLDIIPLEQKDLDDENYGKIRLLKITQLVYQRNESVSDKLATVLKAVAVTGSSVITMITSNGEKTDFYLGIRALSEEVNASIASTAFETLENAIEGQFPGSIMDDDIPEEEIKTKLQSVGKGIVTAVSCIANKKNKDYLPNAEYLQGLEKFAVAMQKKEYTAVIIANPAKQEEINQLRNDYERLYTLLSPWANTVFSLAQNTASSTNTTETRGTQTSQSETDTFSQTNTSTITRTEGTSISISDKTKRGKLDSSVGVIGRAVMMVGDIIKRRGPGSLGGAFSAIGEGSRNEMETKGSSKSTSIGTSTSTTRGHSSTTTSGTSYSKASSQGHIEGETKTQQRTIQDKHILNMLARIDQQIARVQEFESMGMWECAAYFLSNDPKAAQIAGNTYQALMSGENSGVEGSAINTWLKADESSVKSQYDGGKSEGELLAEYVLRFQHPVFNYHSALGDIRVTPAKIVSGNELAIHMGLPRSSVAGCPVIEHVDFGKEVVKYDQGDKSTNAITLGKIFNMGRAVENSQVDLNIESLAMHTFIVGSTGSGKSNTVYQFLDQLASKSKNMHFMVIEPAKGEYKNIFSSKRYFQRNVKVLSTIPKYAELLRINPFRFPKGIDVLEHVERLVEIFNVCWPMYAAMPAVLKDAVLQSYQACGWDLKTSENFTGIDLYPTFRDLLEQLGKVIDESGYSEEVKSNYKGSLMTRVKSLTNGINGMLLTNNETKNDQLFDKNVIVDLSNVGSQETKALLMGVLVMRLAEHRKVQADASNKKLQHVTVLEEAHNILKAPSTVSTEEGGNVAAKSVEMLANAIAEMRTYGEGFVIADQSPSNVDMAAIRNTNTKIIMRLPEETDRRIAGKAAALKDEQLGEIAKLPRGVAVVYQNDWVEPVLCQIDKYADEEKPYVPKQDAGIEANKAAKSVLINWLLYDRLKQPRSINVRELDSKITQLDCAGTTRRQLARLRKEQKNTGKLSLWAKGNFAAQAKIIKDVLDIGNAVAIARQTSFDDMTDFNIYINTRIGHELDEVSDDILITVEHCLIKAYAEDNKKDGQQFYQAWKEDLNKKGMIL